MLALTAAGAGVAAVFGDIALASLEGMLYWRRASGRPTSWGLLIGGAALIALLVVTAALGGHLVYGLGVNVAGVR